MEMESVTYSVSSYCWAIPFATEWATTFSPGMANWWLDSLNLLSFKTCSSSRVISLL